MNEDIEYTPIKEPTFFEKVIIMATMILAALFFPLFDKCYDDEGKQKR